MTATPAAVLAVVDWMAFPSDFLRVLIATVLVTVAIVLYSRLIGLRSFSKMSSIDFAMTVAMGSLVASIVLNPSPPLLLSLFSLLCVFVAQWIFAKLRFIQGFSKVAENKPTLLMDGPTILHENLKATTVTEDDLMSKLREANVLSFDEVRAVVLESTGDISVLHAADPAKRLEGRVMKGVSGRPAQASTPGVEPEPDSEPDEPGRRGASR